MKGQTCRDWAKEHILMILKTIGPQSDPRGWSVSPRDNKQVYYHNIEISSTLKSFCQ